MRKQGMKHISREDANRLFKIKYSSVLPFMGPASVEIMWGGFVKDEIARGTLPRSAKSWSMPGIVETKKKPSVAATLIEVAELSVGCSIISTVVAFGLLGML